jgi:hypothetical protein
VSEPSAPSTATRQPDASTSRPPATSGQAKASDRAAQAAEAERLAQEQRALIEKQAEANARLQQELERLKPREYVLPAGTIIPVRTTAELSTDRLSTGSTFDALLERDLASDGVVLAKAGTRVTGVVVSSDPGGRVKGVASLSVGAQSVVGVKGNVISLRTDSYSTDAESTKKKDAVRTGVATGIGAAIGAIAGGGKGAAIGAGAGAAAGVGTNMATRGAAAVIPAEQLIEFELTSPATVVMQP